MGARKQDVEVMYGTLDLMILKTLSWGPRHGLAILLWINEVTQNRLVIEEGALYPALSGSGARDSNCHLRQNLFD